METETSLRATERPDLTYLVGQYNKSNPFADNGWDRESLNEDIRFCRWPGQNEDGTKEGTDETPPFPWPGASDIRNPRADEVIQQKVSMWLVALWRVLLNIDRSVGPAGMEDADAAGAFRNFIHWLVRNRLFASLVEEGELYKQYKETYGWAVLQVDWERQVQNKHQEITLQDVMAIAKAKPEYRELVEIVMNPEREDEAILAFRQIFDAYVLDKARGILPDEVPTLKDKKIRKAIKRLRDEGTASVVVPYVCRNEPVVVALKPWEDILLPDGTTDIQRARVVFRREWLTEAQLRAKEWEEGWDKGWIDKAATMKGVYDWAVDYGTGKNPFARSVSLSRHMEREDLIEVVYAYQWLLDEDDVPGIYCTVFHPEATKDDYGEEIWAKHELLDYKHGRMPFVVATRERHDRDITSSRGVPELMANFQRIEKVQMDAAIDQTSLVVSPPLNIMADTLDMPYKFGPNAQNPVRPGREPRVMDLPIKGVTAAYELLDYVERRVDQYFGRQSEKAPPMAAQVMMQAEMVKDLCAWTQAFQQLFQLAMQYMPAEEFERVTGQPPNWTRLPAEINNQYDFVMNFDVRELDTDHLVAKLQAIRESVIPYDRGGSFDYDKYLNYALRAIDPSLSEMQKDPQEATEATYRKVQGDLVAIANGIEPMYDQDVNPSAQRELQFAQQILQGSPSLQQRLAQDKAAQDLLQNWAKNKEQSVKQQENRQIGRQGVTRIQQ